MRIAVITVSVGSHVRVYVEHLRASGHDVTVLTNSGRYLDTDVPTIDLRPFGGRTLKLPRAFLSRLRERRLCRALAHGDFDVVNCQMVMLDALTALGCSPAPVVLSFHGSDLYRRAQMPEAFAARLPAALGRAAAIHAVSKHMADELVGLGAPSDHVTTFQYGIDLSAFSPAPKRDESRIVSVRALKPLYRVDLLIEAMPLVLASIPQAVLEVYDEGPELLRLREIASSLNLDQSVRFLGRQPLERIAEVVGVPRCGLRWRSRTERPSHCSKRWRPVPTPCSPTSQRYTSGCGHHTAPSSMRLRTPSRAALSRDSPERDPERTSPRTAASSKHTPIARGTSRASSVS